MVIVAGGLIIDCRFKFEDNFINLSNYKTDDNPEFLLESSFENLEFEYKNLEFETEYYYIFDTNLGKYQVQKGDIGAVLYQDKKVIIYPFIKEFNAEYLLSQYAFVYWIRKYTKSLFIHSSSIKYNDYGFLLCAKSGTGKSTHRRLWEANGGLCINDDKNVVSLIDDKLYILPNPWSGKHFCDNNEKVELKAIVFLSQSANNEAEDLDSIKAMTLLLGQTQLPSKETKEVWNILFDKLLELRLIKYGCNMEKSAFEILKAYLEV